MLMLCIGASRRTIVAQHLRGKKWKGISTTIGISTTKREKKWNHRSTLTHTQATAAVYLFTSLTQK